jgi:hypothetical protein
MSLSRSYNLGHMFCGLTQVDSGRFIVSCFSIDFFFPISTLKNELIKNWVS